MGITQSLPDIEDWLNAEASSWSSLSDQEYKTLVRHWTEVFVPLVAASNASLSADGASCVEGDWAMMALERLLPADIYILSGMRVRQLANTGGYGAAAYRANGLRHVLREVANQQEVIVVSANFLWSCVFSHEAGTLVWEQLYVREENTGSDDQGD